MKRGFGRNGNTQKNPRAHKNKIGTPPPPPKKGNLRTWFFLQKERIFPGVHKIGAPISGPRIADTNFTDTTIFLKYRPNTGQPAPKYHTKGCSRSSADSPGARTLVFAAFEPFHSSEFRASTARTPFCAILWRSPKQITRAQLGPFILS